MSGNNSNTNTRDGDSSATSNDNDGQRTTPMRHTINIQSLSSWMVHQPVFSDLFSRFLTADGYHDEKTPSSSPSSSRLKTLLEDRLEIRQFGFGQSNPTYLLTIHASPTKVDLNVALMRATTSDSKHPQQSKQQFVLRRKPNKVAHPSSHALHREYRVLESLTNYNEQLLRENNINNTVPIPRPYAYCNDASILGAEFYVMEYVKGRIFVDPRMPIMANSQDRLAAYVDAIRVLSVRKRRQMPGIHHVCIDHSTHNVLIPTCFLLSFASLVDTNRIFITSHGGRLVLKSTAVEVEVGLHGHIRIINLQ
jgi:hypothetical protein